MFRKLSGFLLAAIPLLVVIGLLRAVALLRRGTGASWRDAVGAFLIWQSTTLTVTSASLQGLFAKEAVFLRTPKTHGDARWTDAIKANWVECLFGVLGLAAIAGALSRTSPGGFLLAGLLVWPTVSFLAAPYNSLSAQRAALPPDLRERRRTEYLRYGARRLTYAVGGLGLAGGTAAVALGLFVPGTAHRRTAGCSARRRGSRCTTARRRRRARRTPPGSTGEHIRLGPGEEIEGFEHDEHEHHVDDHDVIDIHDVHGADDVDGHLDDELDRHFDVPDHHFIHDRDGPDELDHRVDHDARADEHHVDDAVVTCGSDVPLSWCSRCRLA